MSKIDQNAINFANYLVENNWFKDITRTDLNCWFNRKLQLLDYTLEDIYKLYINQNG